MKGYCWPISIEFAVCAWKNTDCKKMTSNKIPEFNDGLGFNFYFLSKYCILLLTLNKTESLFFALPEG